MIFPGKEITRTPPVIIHSYYKILGFGYQSISAYWDSSRETQIIQRWKQNWLFMWLCSYSLVLGQLYLPSKFFKQLGGLRLNNAFLKFGNFFLLFQVLQYIIFRRQRRKKSRFPTPISANLGSFSWWICMHFHNAWLEFLERLSLQKCP